MKDYLLSVRDSMMFLALGVALAFLIFLGVRFCQAQQPVSPGQMPAPTCPGGVSQTQNA
jgi:hypothetical protein